MVNLIGDKPVVSSITCCSIGGDGDARWRHCQVAASNTSHCNTDGVGIGDVGSGDGRNDGIQLGTPLLSGTTSVTPLWETITVQQLGYEMERYSKKSSVVQMMKLMLEKYVA